MINIGITWHREDKIINKDLCILNLNNSLNELLSKYNDIVFHLWWANGIDNWVWLWCIDNNIKYKLHLPFKDSNKQIYNWNDVQKDEFNKVFKSAQNIIYYNWYFERNKWIVDNSDILYYYCTNMNSWTGYTIRYAQSKKKETTSLI